MSSPLGRITAALDGAGRAADITVSAVDVRALMRAVNDLRWYANSANYIDGEIPGKWSTKQKRFGLYSAAQFIPDRGRRAQKTLDVLNREDR